MLVFHCFFYQFLTLPVNFLLSIPDLSDRISKDLQDIDYELAFASSFVISCDDNSIEGLVAELILPSLHLTEPRGTRGPKQVNIIHVGGF